LQCDARHHHQLTTVESHQVTCLKLKASALTSVSNPAHPASANASLKFPS